MQANRLGSSGFLKSDPKALHNAHGLKPWAFPQDAFSNWLMASLYSVRNG